MALFWGDDQLYDIYQNKLDFDIQARADRTTMIHKL